MHLVTGDVTGHGVAERGYVTPEDEGGPEGEPIPAYVYVTDLVEACLRDIPFRVNFAVVTVDAMFYVYASDERKQRSPRLAKQFGMQEEANPDDEQEEPETALRGVFSSRVGERTIRDMVRELAATARAHVGDDGNDLIVRFAETVQDYFPWDFDTEQGKLRQAEEARSGRPA